VTRDGSTSPDLTRRHILRQTLNDAGRLIAVAGIGCLAWLSSGRRADSAGLESTRPSRETSDESATRRRSVDPYRLPRHVIPSRYELTLAPDFATFTFTGQETVMLTVRQVTSELVLNAADLAVTSARIENDHGAAYDGTVEAEEALERCRIRFSAALQPGDWRLKLTFNGVLNDKLRGFYRSSYKDQAGTVHWLAATQFEATDARRAFPCWDEPDFKAVFAATLVIDPALTAVSNTRILSERRDGGKKVVRFADTIRMSTYLVAFVVGELEATDPVTVGRTPLRVWAVPGKRHLARFAQEIGAFSLQFFEQYYGIPYPGDKLDLIAIPDFASGAMENLGAITFRETALLVDQRTATHAELERVADVVAHENAHMWFGDLVTMSWWNGLWLNEAFATFMEMLAVDAWKPEWQRWATFGASRAAALSVDGLHSTRPIEYPVRAPKDADAMFDVLTYEKGAAVLRMLEQHLGPAVFRDGVRDYLRTHAYANADTGDLWTSLGKAATLPVPELMDAWIFKPGYPLVSVTRNGTSELVISQQRFTYLDSPLLPSDSAAASSPSTPHLSPTTWQVPIQLRITAGGRTETRRLLLKDKDTTLTLPPGFESVLLNEGGHGFYRVRYAPELLERLLPLVPDRLAPTERFNLINDAWAAAIAGLMPLDTYLDLTDRYKADRDKNVWGLLLDSFQQLNRIIESRDRPALEALVRDRVGPLVETLGWAPRQHEDELTRQLRGELIRALGTLGNHPAMQARAAELYRAYLKDADAVDPNVVSALVAILAHTGDQSRYDEFSERFRKATTPQEERRYLFALAAFRRPELLERTLARTLNGEIRTQDGPFLVGAMLGSVYGRELAWQFMKVNWDTMDRVFPKNGLRRMCGGIVGLATPELERDVREFFASRKIDLGGKTLEQYLEQLRVVVRFRERSGGALRDYLERFSAT
jgi:puromycin-sensitive aminopeptidase